MKTPKLPLIALLTFVVVTQTFADDAWRTKLATQLPLLGHRNWIVVVDSAYPLQTAQGIETLYVNADQLDVVKGIIAELAKTNHVKPTIYTDAELKFVAEANAPGIGGYREALATILKNQPAQVLNHLVPRPDDCKPHPIGS